MKIFLDIDRKLRDLKRRAIRKGIEFDLDKDWLNEKKRIGRCEATGIKFDMSKKPHLNPLYPTIDRIDSEKGYTKANCQIVCHIFNIAKCEFDESVFEKWAKAYVIEYEKKRGVY